MEGGWNAKGTRSCHERYFYCNFYATGFDGFGPCNAEKSKETLKSDNLSMSVVSFLVDLAFFLN